MDASHLSLLICLGLISVLYALQQVIFLRQIQKLVDKVMSRSYTEYVAAEKPKLQVNVPQDVPEDLRTLQEFQYI